jgi:hypothetical protein
MKVEYNRQGAARKELVQAISDITCTKAKYLFLPTRAYQIGSIRVEEFGTVECEDAELLQKVVKELVNLGIKPAEPVDFLGETAPEATEPVETVAAEETPEPEEKPEPEPAQNGTEYAEKPETNEADTLTISLPDDLTDEDFAKLQNLVASKASIFKKALGTDDLTIQRVDGKISFPWFHGTGSARAQAYAKLVTALCQLAKKSKRITAKEHEVLNEKYAFRCFLLRLGFIGKEYKDCRKILLERLSGSAAFRDGGKKDAVSQ